MTNNPFEQYELEADEARREYAAESARRFLPKNDEKNGQWDWEDDEEDLDEDDEYDEDDD